MTGVAAPDRVLIVDDHSLVRDGLRNIFDECFPDCEILEADDFEGAMSVLAGSEEVDLVLLDVNMPNITRLSGLQQLRDEYPATPVVMVSGTFDRTIVREALAVGAAGFIPKSLKRAAIIDALEQVLAGEIFIPELEGSDHQVQEEETILARINSLTPQQRVVLGHLVAGLQNKQITYELGVSMTTVKAHVSAILQKMHAYSRTQAVIFANKVDFRN